MTEYPFFKGETVIIDYSVEVSPSLAQEWKDQGFKKIKTLTHGTDHIHTSILPVENTPNLNTDSTTQWAIWKLLEWAYNQNPPIQLADKKAVVIGYGNIGQAITKILRGFEITNFVHDKVFGWATPERLKKMLSEADFVFVCLPLTDETRSFFWDKKDWINPNQVIISISRRQVTQDIPFYIIQDDEHIAWRTKESLERKRKITKETNSNNQS
jgi:phosphoglycerate dehydrogenase-like enzyme